MIHREPPAADILKMRGLVIARLFNDKTGMTREYQTHNLITSAGDVHYAERATTKTPTNTFNLLHLSTEASTAPVVAKDAVYGDIASYIAGSSAVLEAAYPVSGDTEANNSGAGNSVVSWKFVYSKGAFNSGVVRGVITTTGPTSGTPLLSDFVFASTFTKTSDDTLTVYANHTVLGST